MGFFSDSIFFHIEFIAFIIFYLLQDQATRYKPYTCQCPFHSYFEPTYTYSYYEPLIEESPLTLTQLNPRPESAPAIPTQCLVLSRLLSGGRPYRLQIPLYRQPLLRNPCVWSALLHHVHQAPPLVVCLYRARGER